MAKKFKCPECGGGGIEQVTFNLRRISSVVGVDNMVDNAFLCSGAKIENMESTQPETFYRCSIIDCRKILGTSVENIINKFFPEEQKLLPSPNSEPIKPAKFETYKMKELKHCQGDGLSVRELIDVVNFMNHASGNKLTVRPDSKQPASVACMKFIKTGRPYLFEKVE